MPEDRTEFYRRLRQLAPDMVGILGSDETEVLRFLLRLHPTDPETAREAWKIRQRERAERALAEARRIPRHVRAEVLAIGECAYCGDLPTEVDHIIPVCQGGNRRRRNLAPACRRCNGEKLGSTPAEWRAWRIRAGYGWPPVPMLQFIERYMKAHPDEVQQAIDESEDECEPATAAPSGFGTSAP